MLSDHTTLHADVYMQADILKLGRVCEPPHPLHTAPTPPPLQAARKDVGLQKGARFQQLASHEVSVNLRCLLQLRAHTGMIPCSTHNLSWMISVLECGTAHLSSWN